MADLYAVAGSTISIGGVLSAKATDFVAGDFASQTWTAIDGWQNVGAIGDAAEVIKTALINQGRVIKQKGTNDAGSCECTFAIVSGDPGQAALIAAQKVKSNYAFKIVWSDGVTDYFIALVSTRNRGGGDANAVQMRTFALELNSNVVSV